MSDTKSIRTTDIGMVPHIDIHIEKTCFCRCNWRQSRIACSEEYREYLSTSDRKLSSEFIVSYATDESFIMEFFDRITIPCVLCIDKVSVTFNEKKEPKTERAEKEFF